MWTVSFWRATAERVVSAFAFSLLGVLGTVETFDLHAFKWGQILTTAGFAAGITLLKCIVAVNIGPRGSPSLVADPAAAGQPDRPDPAAAEKLVPSHVRKVGGYPGGGPTPPPGTRATGSVWTGSAPPD